MIHNVTLLQRVKFSNSSGKIYKLKIDFVWSETRVWSRKYFKELFLTFKFCFKKI